MKPTSTVMGVMRFAVIAPVNTVLRKRRIQHGLNIAFLAVELTQHEQNNEAQTGKDGANSHRIETSFRGGSTEGNAGHADHDQQDAQRIHRPV